jgi:hypothetical protein
MIVLAGGERAANVWAPHSFGTLIKSIAEPRNSEKMAWKQLTLFLLLQFLQGGAGLIRPARSLVVFPVRQVRSTLALY